MRNPYSRARHLLPGLALLAFVPLLLGFLCLPLPPPIPSGVPTPTPAANFAPTVSASVATTSPGAASDIQAHLSFPEGSTLAIGSTFDIPAGWVVASDATVTDGSRAGSISGFMTVDNPAPFFLLPFGCNTTVSFDPAADPPTDIKLLEATINTTSKVSGADSDTNGQPDVVEDVNPANGLPDGVDKYPAFLNIVLPPLLAEWGATVKARYFGHTQAAGISDLYVNVIVFQLALGGPYRVLTITNDPTSRPEGATSRFCAPQSLTLTLLGTSQDNPDTTGVTEGGQALYTNPASAGSYIFTAALVSEFDHDNDGASNGFDNCPFISNPTQADGDKDYVGNACDANASTADFDVDGDDIENGYDNCIFVANSATLGPNNQLDSDFDDIGDACDPAPSVPNGPNYYLSCTDPVGIGQADPGGASCVEGVPAPTPAPTPTPKDPSGDTDGDTIPNSSDPDDDNDGCTDVVELGMNEVAGGLRDPHNFWDFADQWVGVPPAKNGTVTVGDLGAVVARFGTFQDPILTKEEAQAEALTPPVATTGYHASADRSGSAGPNPWNLLPPNGTITIGDLGVVVAQFGHFCG